MPDAEAIRVVVYREENMWVGQCLEVDIGAQAKTLETLMSRMVAIINAEREQSIEQHNEPFVGIDQAPPYFHRLWDKRAGHYTPKGEFSDTSFDIAMCG